ncbi:MAG TPA: hypothetical protein GX739_02755 [Firmicutes bacterium]|nr:hypothetical protein [Bacillota bacterium]
MAQKRIMIISSDSSSDLYGAQLAKALESIAPDAALFGVGGSLMEESNVRLLYNVSDLENLGGLEALKTPHVIKRLVQRIARSMDKFQPELVVQIGLPVFSLKLIELAKTKGLPVVYYNSPLNWGTEPVKLSRLAKVVDKIITVSRYESRLCEKHGIDVEFAGHPLVDLASVTAGQELRGQLELATNLPVAALLPGGREADVKMYLPTLLKAVKRINMEQHRVQTVIAVPQSIRPECCEAMIEKSGLEAVKITDDVSGILTVADVAVVTSRSESIMAALARVPAVAVHKVATTAYFVDKMLLRKANFAMINFLMQEEVLPELVQTDFTEKKTAEAMLRFLQDSKARTEYFQKLERLPEELGTTGAIARAAQIIANML